MAAIPGLDFPMYVYKPRRGMKRGEESKDTYKLPHRLIEKKRRDRINECIAQLKDLLPEHLKLSTLGHLEKAVVLELTLKHVKALNSLLEQQQQQILSLQNGIQLGDYKSENVEYNEEMFRSGFHLCAKEVLQYVARQENTHDLSTTQIVEHLDKVASDLLQCPGGARPESPPSGRPALELREKPTVAVAVVGGQQVRVSENHTKNCVPVIQRTFPQNSEQSGSDTDTDSGYGGEPDKDKCERAKAQRPSYYEGTELRYGIKEEWDEPDVKRPRTESSEDESHTAYTSFSPHNPATPLCMPFYVLPHMAAAAAAYLPVLDKCWYPGSMSMLYPGMGGHAVMPPEKMPHSLIMSPRVGSPVDSPTLHHTLKQVPLINLETKD